MKTIAIIIPVHNKRHLTQRCLANVRSCVAASDVSLISCEIVVVDDGSRDGSSEWIEDNYPNVHVVSGNGNLWWGGAINKGTAFALDTLNADYILWWNNDVLADEAYLTNLQRILAQSQNSTIIGSKVYLKPNSDILWSFGGAFDPRSGSRRLVGLHDRDGEMFSNVKTVDWLPGMGTVFHKSVFESVGFVDAKTFPQYHGDSDFSFRAKKHGYKLLVDPSLKIWNDPDNSGIRHDNSVLGLVASLFCLRSTYNFGKDIAFYKRHAVSPRAYLALAARYGRYLSGFFKRKLAGVFSSSTKTLPRMYLYPLTARRRNGPANPYIFDLADALGSRYTVANRNTPSTYGILDLFKYWFSCKYFYFNWVENLPDRKWGAAQTALLLVILPFLRLSGKHVIWTMHNKFGHNGKNRWLKGIITSSLLKHCQTVVCHTSAGEEFAGLLGQARPIHFLPLPVKKNEGPANAKQSVDILIWGQVAPYKGIDKFLEHLRNKRLDRKYRVLVSGKVSDKEYREKLLALAGEKVQIDDRYLSDEELSTLIRSSKVVLFTYDRETVLSSSALMDTLGHGAVVLGPAHAAFKDLSEHGVISVYENLDDLVEKADKLIAGTGVPSAQTRNAYVNEHGWRNFVNELADRVEMA